MSPRPPEPPPLAAEQVRAVVDWLDALAAWLRDEQAEAAAHGHATSPESARNLRLYEDAGLLFREAYDA